MKSTMKLHTIAILSYILLLAWFIICIMLYVYASHMGFVQIVDILNWKAFFEMLTRISPLHFMTDLLGALLGVMLFSLACLSLGLCFLPKLILSQSSKLAQAVTSFLIGEILFSLVFLMVISLYGLPPTFVAITTTFGFLVGFPRLKGFITDLLHEASLATDFKMSERIILALAIIGMILGLSLSTTRLSYDATAGYFSHAKIMAVSQLPTFFYPNDSFVVSSFHPGILFAAIIQLFGDQSARLLSWVNGIAILLMGLALGKEIGLSNRARLWFLTLMVTSTAFMDLLGDGKIELISTTPIVATVYWLAYSTKQQPAKGTFVLIGLLSGFAIISRPYNIFLVSLFMVMFIIGQAFIEYRISRFDFNHFIQSALWIMPPLLILGTFHLFQNWIWLKSPIAPLTYAKGLKSSDWQWEMNPLNLAFYRLLYPLTLTFLNSQQSLGNISPLLVGSLPFLLVKRIRENLKFSAILARTSIVTILTLLLWIIFFFTVLEIRYVFFLWIILFLATAQILESATQHADELFRLLFRPLLIVFLAIMCGRTFLIATITYFPITDIGHSYCPDSNLCNFMDTLNKSAASGDRVFVLHAYRYYLRPDLFACSSRVDEYPALEKLARQNSPDFWVELYRQGFHFIIYEPHLSERRYNFGKLPGLETVPEWMDIRILYSNPKTNQQIYKLETFNPPLSSEVSCEQSSAGIWQLIFASVSEP